MTLPIINFVLGFTLLIFKHVFLIASKVAHCKLYFLELSPMNWLKDLSLTIAEIFSSLGNLVLKLSVHKKP